MFETAPARNDQADRGGVRAALVCGSLIIASLVFVAIPAASPARPDLVAALFPPWWSSGRIIAAAATAGAPVAVGRWTSIVVVRGDQNSAARLRSAGALFLMDPRNAIGCDIQGQSRT